MQQQTACGRTGFGLQTGRISAIKTEHILSSPLNRRIKPMRTVDLRSDTLTKPTPAMRRAMAEAEVGDDVFGEDPTVRRLEEMAAERMDKEAALFVVSGTMGNLVSQLAHCGRGDEIILGDRAHTFLFEQGGSAALGGIHSRTVVNQADGKLALGDIETAIRTDNVHFPRTRLIMLENTHNMCNGSPLEVDYMNAVGNLAHRHGLRLHVDGARIFNAAVALGVAAGDLVAKADSVTFCLSKGLGAPVGSVVCGTRDFVAEARRARKVLGGGMRQAGVIAAAGIVALDEMVDRLAEDHANARKLADGLAQVSGLVIDPSQIRTNIVFFETREDALAAPDLAQRLESDAIRVIALSPRRIRAVTNHHITASDIEYALSAISKIMRAVN
jgi:threonine aldolase